MNDRAAFLEAIRTNPHEDAVRLVYADWLDENAQSDLDTATAEFIRVSCFVRGRYKMPSSALAL